MNQDSATQKPSPPQPPALQPALQREAIVHTPSRAEPHRVVLLAIAGMALLSLLVPLVIVTTQQRPAMTVITVESQAVPSERIVVVERAVEAVPEQPVTEQMRAADDAIGAAIATGAELAPERPWHGIAASPGPFAVASVWSAAELHVSRDDGRTFRQVLGGPGEIGGVAIDETGVVYAVRDARRLGLHTPDGKALWRELPFAGETLGLIAADGWLAWLGLARDTDDSSAVVLAVSADGGQTWRTQRVAEHADQALIAMDDGAIHLLTLVEDASAPTMKRLLGHVDGRALQELSWPTDYADAWGLGHGGWAYAIASECAGADNAICAVSADAAATGAPVMLPSGVVTDWDLLMHSNGGATLAVSGDRLLRAHRSRMTVADERIPAGISALAVDGIDRALAVVGEHVVRWSPTHGWRVLHSADGRIDYSER